MVAPVTDQANAPVLQDGKDPAVQVNATKGLMERTATQPVPVNMMDCVTM